MPNPRVPTSTPIPLAALTRADREVAGGKAATLGELARAGFPVPAGFVVTGEPDEQSLAAARALGDGPLAVRSSAISEDLADASFAGQYETVLDVRGADALLAAIRQVRQSAHNVRVQHYRAARAGSANGHIAVLVQRMLAPMAAGVALTANPVTGDRGEVVITAARGLGERVVSGQAVGDEWVVTAGQPACRRSVEQAIDAGQALAIAALARRVETHLGAPQDIEWAIEGGQLYLLQARPMTALPEPLPWQPPAPGYWMRNFRLGEWLPDAVTPLFREWLLERIEEGYLMGMRQTTGAVVPFRHAVINGWYYMAAPNASSIPLILARAVAQSRGRVMPVLFNALVRVNFQPEHADRALLRGLERQWRQELLPRYMRVVAESESRIDTATAAEVAELVDRVGRLAGEYLWSLAIVGGSAWKMEGCLARFLRRYLAPAAAGEAPVLLRGLPDLDLEVPAHAVQSADWYWPTAGELGGWRADEALGERRRRLSAERVVAETACRQALADRPSLLARFESLLELAQRYARIREEQTRGFTLGWPLLRRCALRLGATLRARAALDRPEDVFFLVSAELWGRPALQDVVERRRADWERQRRLVAPLTIGKPPRLMTKILAGTVEAVRVARELPEGAIVGEPASPGRASGRVRIVRGAEDFDRFQPGEVLVAQATAPAWTPLFGRAAAVVTDGGTLAAHASLVAREYGIPAVVATGDATTRFRDGQMVIVDGSAGTVQPQP
ncbi:MAG: PEP/pyruvate-binding domain-containing protein [Chloroflexota bacterium]